MSRYLTRRVLLGFLAIGGVTVVTFFAVFGMGDPAVLMLPPGNRSPAEVAALREQLGLDRPLFAQFGDFVRSALGGDFGDSLRYRMPAMDLVRTRLPETLKLVGAAIGLATVVGVGLGVTAAKRQGSRLDRAIMTISTVGLSAPTFWIGAMLIVVFAVNLRWLPPSGSAGWQNMILPAATLASSPVAIFARFTRAGLVEALGQDFIVTARAKGLPDRLIYYRHALRNALIPVVTLIGLEFGALVGGTIITETVFAWPGMGSLLVESVFLRDFPVIIAIVLIAATAFVLINVLVDIASAWLNPRVSA